MLFVKATVSFCPDKHCKQTKVPDEPEPDKRGFSVLVSETNLL